MSNNDFHIKFKQSEKVKIIDNITFQYFDQQNPVKLFDFNEGQYSSFLKETDNKNWQEVAYDLFSKSNYWLFDIITNQTRSDFIFLFDLKKNDLALDMGAGWGQVSIPLSNLCTVVVLEGNQEKIEINKKISSQENRNNLKYVIANITEKIFEDNQFNLIILNGVLEWLGSFSNGDPIKLQQEALKEIYNLLKPGGYLYIGIENKFGLKYLLGENDDHTAKGDLVYLEPALEKSIYNAITEKELKSFTHSKLDYEKLLTSVGFSKIQFLGDLPDYKILNTIVDMSSTNTVEFAFKNLDFIEEYDGALGKSSVYNEKLHRLYSIFSGSALNNLFPSYSIIAQK